MFSHVFLGAFSAMVLSGTACSIALLSERRRKSLRKRLAEISVVTSTGSELGRGEILSQPLLKPRLRVLNLVPAYLLRQVDASLVAAGGSIGIVRLVLTGAVAAGTTAFGLVMGRFPLVLAMALSSGAAFVGTTLLVRFQQSRYRRQFLALFPDALDMISRAVKAGLPVMEAIELSARELAPPVGTEFRRILDEIRVGVEMDEALQQTANRVRLPEFRFFVACIILQRRTGGRLGETLSNLSVLIRQRRVIYLKSRALTAEARATAVVLVVMPFVAVAGLFLVSRQIMLSLFLDSRGRFMLIIAASGLLLGIAIMIGLIRRGIR